MPLELTIISVTALLAGLLLVGIMLAGRGGPSGTASADGRLVTSSARRELGGTDAGSRPDATLRVVWWLTITIVLLGVGISGSFAADQAPIFLLGGGAVLAVVIFHELLGERGRGGLLRLAEVAAAVALIGGLLALTGFASSPRPHDESRAVRTPAQGRTPRFASCGG